MKVVALVSGGKDSCYNMLQCVMAGHDIVALANLKPDSKDELDSYMYQTVGHQGVALYAEAMNIPLFRQPTQGVAILNEKLYTPTPEDEVEDLYLLLLNIKSKIDIEAVSVGAVLSDYQRLRVENVCQRLGLVALAYLWRRDQAELLQEMIDYKINAIIIKVAALGLNPRKHLGLTISEIQPYLVEMNEKYGLHICGEGGEYETFTLDCPLFSKSIIIKDCETVINSNDNIAPAGYLNFRHLCLVDKLTEEKTEEIPLLQRLSNFPIKTAEDYISDIDALEELEQEQSEMESGDSADLSPNNHICLVEEEIVEKEEDICDIGEATIVQSDTGWCWLGGITNDTSIDIVQSTHSAITKMKELLETKGLELKDLVRVVIYLSSLEDYAKVNKSYSEALGGEVNPPVRVCVGTPLSPSSPVRITALAYPHAKQTMHVQSLSHWAPANIGPYSQAIKAGESGEIVYVAGQIGLVPGSMELVTGGVRRQCKLALRHIARLIKCMDRDFTLGHVVQGVCYVTRSSYVREVRQEWEKRTKNAIMDYVVVKELPRQADVEFQIWAHLGNNRFQYEETGCMIGSLKASLRRRWNYDNTVSAVVCCVARASANSGRTLSECGENSELASSPVCDDESSEVNQVLLYALKRLTGPSEEGAPPPVCSLQIYYGLGRCRPQVLHHAVECLAGKFLCATTLIPVVSLNHPATFLSICSVRH